MFLFGPLFPLFAATWFVLAFTATDWATIITAIVGSGLVGQFVVGTKAMREWRARTRDVPLRERTVAAEEAETAMRIMGVTLKQQQQDIKELRVQVGECQEWRREHLGICPLFNRGGLGDR